MLKTLYQGSVKDILGPRADGKSVVFQYTDAYSVFDWGRMPDALPHKGQALAILAAWFFEYLQDPKTWKDWAASSGFQEMQSGHALGKELEPLIANLVKKGLKTHYQGVLPSDPKRDDAMANPVHLAESGKEAIQKLSVLQVSAVRPESKTVLGRSVYDYTQTRLASVPRLVPLEVVFRFKCPAGSSLIQRLKDHPSYLQDRGFGEYRVASGESYRFPILEVFSKLESSDRELSLSEALAVSGLSGEKLNELFLLTAAVAGVLKARFAKSGVDLADGKLEWAIDHNQDLILVDAIGPDELRLLKNGIQLSKEFLREAYRSTSWYSSLNQAKLEAQKKGMTDWKKLVPSAPPKLPAPVLELASQMYRALTHAVTQQKFFKNTLDLDQVATEIGGLLK